MTRLLTSAVPLLIIVLATASPAAVITVDDDGGADYVTIQEAVDAAASGDTVLVHPGVYTGIHECGFHYYETCVCLSRSITLISSGGPEVTIIDAADMTGYGICTDWAVPVVVEGFTITRWTGTGDPWGTAVKVEEGEVRGNVISGFWSGVSTEPPTPIGRDIDMLGSRGDMVIEGNSITENTTGIRLITFGASDVSVAGNTVSDNSGAGVSIMGVGDVSLVGNEITGNKRGVGIGYPSHSMGAQFSIQMFDNRILDSEYNNISINLAEVEPGTSCDITIGGSLPDGNDVHGAGIYNLSVDTFNIDLSVDATYNYWGSTACSSVVPTIYITNSVPDTSVVFEPFVDESHTATYDCQAVPTQASSWGVIKSLYR